MIGFRLKNGAHQRLEVELLIGEIIRDRSQERLVTGRVGHAQVVHGVDQPDAKEIGPDAVHNRARKVGVVARGQPVGQRFAPVARVVRGQRCAIERRGRLRLAGQRLNDVALVGCKNDFLPVARPRLGPDPREEIGEPIILFVGPFLQRMIVASRAVDRHAEKGLRRGLGHQAGVFVQHVEIAGPVLERAALRGEDFPDEHVPGSVGSDAVADEPIIGPHRRQLEPFARDQQQVGPFAGPVIDKLGPLQKGLDEPVAREGGGMGVRK